MSEIGHNSAPGLAKDKLKNVVDRIEQLTLEIRAITEDRKSIFDEAKDAGADLKALRALLKRRGQDDTARERFESVVDAYERMMKG